jgi:outer membrane protein OmpA-like peptidoglycan-associated protein
MGRAKLAVAVAVLGLTVLALVQGLPNRRAMERDLTTRSERALRSAGFTDVEVRFAGRDGTVRLPSTADVDRALAVVRAQEGVRVAAADVLPPPPAPVPPVVSLAIDRGRVLLTGTVPSDGARAALVASAKTAFGPDALVVDNLTVDPTATDAGLAGLGGVLAAFGKEAKGTAHLRNGAITLSGEVPSPAVRDAVVRAATLAVGTASAVTDRLTVVVPPQEVQTQLANLPRITFQTKSAALTPEGLAAVRRAAEILTTNPSVRVRVEGHTDTDGSAAANLQLSQARAQAVLDTLRSLGIAADRMSATGYGETRPKVPDTTQANKATNRRVEFVILTP